MNKKENRKGLTQRVADGSMKTKIFTIPIVLVTIAILIISVSIVLSTAQSMMDELREESEFLLDNVSLRIEDNINLRNDKSTDWYQDLIKELTDSEEILYASFIDDNYEYLANTGTGGEFLGNNLASNDRVRNALGGGRTTNERVKTTSGENALDFMHPVRVNGEVIGALRLGRTIDGVENALKSNVIRVVGIGIIAITLLGYTSFRISDGIIKVIESLGQDSENMAKGDFSMDVPDIMQARGDEFGPIARGNMKMKESIRRILHDVTGEAQTVASYSEELTATTQDTERSSQDLATVIEELANAATSQANDVHEGLEALSSLEDSINLNNTNIGNLNDRAELVDNLKNEGLELINDLVNKTDETRTSIVDISEIINDTSKSTENIAEALNMIKSISDQTNLLALNASIEAARAGDAGRGFAVVAEEIRKLAEESASFAEDIEIIVDDLTEKSNSAVTTMDTVGQIVEEQEDGVSRTNAKFQGISTAIEDIENLINQVNESSLDMTDQKDLLNSLITNLAAVAEENAAGTEEAAASVDEQNSVMGQLADASSDLANIAESLNSSTSVFQI